MGHKKTTDPVPDEDKVKKINGTANNKWQIAKASDNASVVQLLNEDYEPFAVDQGTIWFKKK